MNRADPEESTPDLVTELAPRTTETLKENKEWALRRMRSARS
jgi:hypothetical protein